MNMRDHPIKSLYEGVRNFYGSEPIDHAIKKDLYHGSLVIFGPGDLINDFTFERYPEELDEIKKKAGEKGFDDLDRLKYALRKMSVFKEKAGNDRDGAIAISDKDDGYSIMRAGGYITVPARYDDRMKGYLSEASRLKGGKVNGRHVAGYNFSSLTDDKTAAIIASKGGSSIVTAIGGEIAPDFSEHFDRYEGFFGKLKNIWNRYVDGGEE
jgi:hypothetical protein